MKSSAAPCVPRQLGKAITGCSAMAGPTLLGQSVGAWVFSMPHCLVDVTDFCLGQLSWPGAGRDSSHCQWQPTDVIGGFACGLVLNWDILNCGPVSMLLSFLYLPDGPSTMTQSMPGLARQITPAAAAGLASFDVPSNV